MNTSTPKEETMEKRDKDKKKVKKRIIKIGILVFLIILLLLLLFKCSYDYSQPVPNENRIEQGVINLPDKEEAQKLVNEAVEQGMFQVFMNTNITINNKNEANLLIQNSESNHYTTYVEIYNGEDLIYKSGKIAPGYKLESDKIEKELAPGKYDCQANFHVVDNDNQEINTINLNVTITK